MNREIREFERNPFTREKITSSIGYMYGRCARQLHYSVLNNVISFSKQDIKSMNYGTSMHQKIQKEKFPNMLHEHYVERIIPTIYGINRIGATIDCYDDTRVIEIKPKYSRMAYYQTLIERFVCPDKPILMYSYIYDKLFPLKADYKMSIIYIGRILTSLVHKPPRVPNSDKRLEPCKSCMFKDKCYSENDYVDSGKQSWNKYKPLTDFAINKLLENDQQWK